MSHEIEPRVHLRHRSRMKPRTQAGLPLTQQGLVEPCSECMFRTERSGYSLGFWSGGEGARKVEERKDRVDGERRKKQRQNRRAEGACDSCYLMGQEVQRRLIERAQE